MADNNRTPIEEIQDIEELRAAALGLKEVVSKERAAQNEARTQAMMYQSRLEEIERKLKEQENKEAPPPASTDERTLNEYRERLKVYEAQLSNQEQVKQELKRIEEEKVRALQEAEKAREELREQSVKSQVQRAFYALGGKDATSKLDPKRSVFDMVYQSMRGKIALTEDGSLQVINHDGSPLVHSQASRIGDPYTLEDLMADAAQDELFSGFFNQRSGSGSGIGSNGAGVPRLSPEQQDKLLRNPYMMAELVESRRKPRV